MLRTLFSVVLLIINYTYTFDTKFVEGY